MNRCRALYIPSLPEKGNSSVHYYYGSGQTAYLAVRLKDRFGHYLAPVSSRLLTLRSKDNTVAFEAVTYQDRLDGEHLFTVQAAPGTFSRYLRAEQLFKLDVSGSSMPRITVDAERREWLSAQELVVGWFFLHSVLPIDGGHTIDYKGRRTLLTYLNLEPEATATPTQENSRSGGFVIQ